MASSSSLPASGASSESDSESVKRVKPKGSSGRFTVRQKAILSAHYNAGMKGVGELYSSRIISAARETGLQECQVKVT